MNQEVKNTIKLALGKALSDTENTILMASDQVKYLTSFIEEQQEDLARLNTALEELEWSNDDATGTLEPLTFPVSTNVPLETSMPSVAPYNASNGHVPSVTTRRKYGTGQAYKRCGNCDGYGCNECEFSGVNPQYRKA